MEKTGLPKKKDNASSFDKLQGSAAGASRSSQSKIAIFSQRTFAIIKFILGVCFLSLVYSSSVSFSNEFLLIGKSLRISFWSGAISLLIIYLFIWEPNIIYIKGQKLLEIIFVFFKPLIRIAPSLLPIYTIILFILYWLLFYIFHSPGLIYSFLFLFGFSITLHLIFSAKSMRSKQGDFLKANYIFGFSLIYIINLALLALCLSLIFEEFSFINYCNNSLQISKSIFAAVFKQLFL